MNIVTLSDHDAEGGAATAKRRIEQALFNHGRQPIHQIAFFPQAIELTLHEVLEISGRPTFHSLWHEEAAWLQKWMRLPRKLFPRWFPRPQTPEFAARRLRAKLRELHPDIINVHNLHAAAPWGWGPRLIEVCLEFAPVVWTLHDMWSFTGRCAYSYDCEKFITGCDATCPTPTEAPALAPDLIQAAWEERRAIFNRHQERLILVTPSRWLANEARRGMFAKHRVEVIPYGLTQWSPPASQADARRRLDIPLSAPVLLVAAVDLTERRKGAHVLPHVWKQIDHRPLIVLTMGRGTIAIDDPEILVRSLGFIDDEKKRTLAYSAADALLHPAPVDNFPNVILEAMACGTPTIAMPVGGVPELVRPGVSGWLADAATPEALGHAVNRARREIAAGRTLRPSCLALARDEYSLELQGRRYYELFQQLSRQS